MLDGDALAEAARAIDLPTPLLERLRLVARYSVVKQTQQAQQRAKSKQAARR